MITIMPDFSGITGSKLLINVSRFLSERYGGETFTMLMCELPALLRFF